jgi:hypothetical protein
MEYLCHKWPHICSTCRKHFPILSPFMTYHRFVTRLTLRVSLVERELLTLPEHLSSPPVYIGVRVTRSFVLYVCFVGRCLSFWTFYFGHCVVCSSSIYGLWLPLWYLQTLAIDFVCMSVWSAIACRNLDIKVRYFTSTLSAIFV